MITTTFQVSLWIELFAASLGGIHGAMFAAGERRRRLDVLGVITLGLTVALGGSLLRDIVLNQPPVVIWMNWYLVAAAAAAVLGMLLQPLFTRADGVFTVLDAIVMGVFGAIAASKALALGVGPTGALFVGVIGAIGGGMLRDLILNRPISFLHVGTLYAVAAGAGVVSLVVLLLLGAPIVVAGVVCVAVTTLVRLGSVFFGWTFPEQRAVIHPREPQ
ncbi:hypothetical protein GCM10009718_13440 [Isoptericola halotolerans]|uniref:Membrane protein YeiH n=1 Tax=Isoptericola halotolerans TaxID=300560 RepID=A0ABX1ZZ37_9MICO|nr:TRIC cation channel family protein [Isoptericola halotolerans]NOV95736.1 putative membrane protein YeiH [Isoptericola halotolerans]